MKRLTVKNGLSLDFSAVTIIGDRIALVPVTKIFAAEIFHEFDADTTKYMVPQPAKDIVEIFDFIAMSQQGMRREQELVFAIIHGLSGEFLGVCSCTGRESNETPELGIWLKKSAHGHKFGLESISILMQWLFMHIQFDYLIYPVARANVASRKIPESLGGKLFATRQFRSTSGKVLDEVVYHIKNALAVPTSLWTQSR